MKLNLPWVPEDQWSARTNPLRPDIEAKCKEDGQPLPFDEECIADPVWRTSNLFDIRTDDGTRMPFVPTEEQKIIIWDIHVRKCKALIIPKARRLGLSTVLGIISADMIAFEAGVEVALVDKTRESAEEKLQRIVRFAVDSLHPAFRKSLVSPQGMDNQSTLGLRSATATSDDIVSTFSAGVSFRGAGPTMLWISEWSAIQFDNPSRSEEIKTGAMEAARRGIRVIESSWKGGKGGHVWDYVTLAFETEEHEKSPEDWRMRFFPWWVDKRNVRNGNMSRIDEETHRYLDEKEQELEIKFTPQQRLWYYQAKRENGIFVKRENPTTVDECWSAPVEGAIYADLIERMRVERKILPFDASKDIGVSTAWDLGSPQNTVVWYFQRLGRDLYDVIDVDVGLDLTTEERIEHMNRKGYRYDEHFIPHDGAADQRGGLSFQEELMRAGLEAVRVVPRTTDVEIGINAVRKMLPRCRFNTKLCNPGIDALSAYHAKVEEGQTYRSENIVHDWASHGADGFRTMAEAEAAHMLSGQGGRRFDAEGIKTLDTKAALTDVKFGNINVLERGAAFVEEAEDASWLAMAGRPQIGRWHVIGYASLRGRHVWAVLRADFVEHEPDPRNMCVLAASVGESMMDPDIAAQRVAATSLFFGSCLVVPVSDDPEGMHRALVDAGQDRIMKRPKARVTGKGQMQIGWDAKEQMMEPMASLARRVREEQLECFHPTARQQLATFMRQPGGKVGAMAGYGDEWVKALAVGCHCFGLATPFNPAENRQLRREGAGLAPTMWGGTGGKASSL
jgi:hypothetical protein